MIGRATDAAVGGDSGGQHTREGEKKERERERVPEPWEKTDKEASGSNSGSFVKKGNGERVRDRELGTALRKKITTPEIPLRKASSERLRRRETGRERAPQGLGKLTP